MGEPEGSPWEPGGSPSLSKKGARGGGNTGFPHGSEPEASDAHGPSGWLSGTATGAGSRVGRPS